MNLSDAMKASIPTESELKISANTWYERQRGTLLDELPKSVLELSVPTHFFEIDVSQFGKAFDGDLTEPKRLAKAASSVWDWEQKVGKICTRSPKDVWTANGVTTSAVQGISWMLYSERIFDDMAKFSHLECRAPTLAVRDVFFGAGGVGTWEFRCFVRDSDLIAVTDYDYINPNKYIASDQDLRQRVRKMINEFFDENIRDEMPIHDYVFDVVLTKPEELLLIEVNPYGLSDPCFFKTYSNVECASSYIECEST